MLNYNHCSNNAYFIYVINDDSIKEHEKVITINIAISDSTQTPYLSKLTMLIGCENSSTSPAQLPRHDPLCTLVEEKNILQNPIDFDAKKCLNKLYAIRDSDADALGYLFETIEFAFAKHELYFVNALLNNFEPNQTKPIISSGLLRATSRAKTKLSSWKICAARVNECLNSRGENTKHILRGIIRADDSFIFSKTAIS